MTIRSLAAAVVLGGAMLFGTHAAHAFSYVTPSDATLLEQADGAVVATVLAPVAATGTGLAAGGYSVRIDRALAGPALMGTQRLALPPMPVNGVAQLTYGIPVLAEGEKVLVFYQRGADGALRPVHLSLGLFQAATTADHHAAWLRSLENGDNLAKDFNAEYHAARDARAFERWITERAAGMKSARDYLLTEPASRSAAKHTLMPTPFRWTQFDGNQTVGWKAVDTGIAGASFDEAAAITQALAAWSNDAGSRILLAYTGTVAYSANLGHYSNPTHAIIWDDPAGEIAGSFSCASGGTLAIGGAWYGGSGGTVNGTSFRQASKGYVITQDGAGCWYAGAGGKNGAEVLTHEIGHALGFGHSCGDQSSCSNPLENQATMRARAHGDGRGAVLNDDDRAVARLVYPAPTGGGGTGARVFRSGFE